MYISKLYLNILHLCDAAGLSKTLSTGFGLNPYNKYNHQCLTKPTTRPRFSYRSNCLTDLRYLQNTEIVPVQFNRSIFSTYIGIIL